MDIALILVVILIIVLIWRGPKMLPRLGEAMGRTVKGVRENMPAALDGDDDSDASAADKTDKASDSKADDSTSSS